ncbi:hypothetical protein YC2023_118725 [Brassica napus]
MPWRFSYRNITSDNFSADYLLGVKNNKTTCSSFKFKVSENERATYNLLALFCCAPITIIGCDNARICGILSAIRLQKYPDLSPTIPPCPTGTGGSWRPNGNSVKSAVAGSRTRDGGHLS